MQLIGLLDKTRESSVFWRQIAVQGHSFSNQLPSEDG